MEWSSQTRELVRLACEEDLGEAGDITSVLLADPEAPTTAHIVARQPGVLCGLALSELLADVFATRLDATIEIRPLLAEGSAISAGAAVGEVRATTAGVLAIERTLLNFVCRLSGITTLTQKYVTAAKRGKPEVQVLDTRKTTPGWRELEKYAVRTGGGENHRFGLFDAVLLKDNHLAGVAPERLAAHIFDCLNRLATKPAFVEIEVDSLDQLAEVLKVVGVDVVLLDNFGIDGLRAAVGLRDERGLNGRVKLEASGGVTLDSIERIAATGVERISCGALTHAAASLDLALDF